MTQLHSLKHAVLMTDQLSIAVEVCQKQHADGDRS